MHAEAWHVLNCDKWNLVRSTNPNNPWERGFDYNPIADGNRNLVVAAQEAYQKALERFVESGYAESAYGPARGLKSDFEANP